MSVTMGSISSSYRYVKNFFVRPSQIAPTAMEPKARALQSVNTSSSATHATRPRAPSEPSVNKHPNFDFEVNPAAARLEISAPQLVVTTSKLALDTKLQFIKQQQADIINLLKYLASLKHQSGELIEKQKQQAEELQTLKVSFQLRARDEIDGLKELVTEKMPVRRSSSRKASSETQNTVRSTRETLDLANKFYAALFKEYKLPESQFPLFKELCTQSTYACLNIANIATDREVTEDQQLDLAKQKEVLTDLKSKLEREGVVLVNKQIALFYQETQAKNQILTVQSPEHALENTDSLETIKERLDFYHSWIETLRRRLGLGTQQATNTSVAQPAIKTNDEARSSRAGSHFASPILKAPTHWAAQPASDVSATLLAHAPTLRKVGSMPDIRLRAAQTQSEAGQARFISKHKASRSVSAIQHPANTYPSMQAVMYSGHENSVASEPHLSARLSSTISDTRIHLNEQEQVLSTKPTASKEIRSINASIDELLGEVQTPRTLKRRSSAPELNKLFNTDSISFYASLHADIESVSRRTSASDLRAVASAQSPSMEVRASTSTAKLNAMEKGHSMPYVPALKIPPKKISTLAAAPASKDQETPLSSPISPISRRAPVRPKRNSNRLSQVSSLSSITEHNDYMSPVMQNSRRSKEVGH